jgi:membrane-associated protease RseP (regulator of RpoE activity)
MDPERGYRPSAGGSELERIRSVVRSYFPVYETTIAPQSLLLAIHVDRATLERKFDELRRELWDDGYVPFLRREHGEEFVEVVRRPRVRARGTWVNLALLAGTVATTVFAGALIWLTYDGQTALTLAAFAYGGIYFAVPIMAILGSHELAHYWAARRRHLDASLPFFLPVPPPLPFGTFGAFVSVRAPFPDRKAQFDVAAAGPLVGFVVAIPISLGGMLLSAHAPVVPATVCSPTVLGLNYGNIVFSPSVLWRLFGLFLPSSFVDLHPLALAGWVGILVTAINLLPIGALDGGRVFRAVFGEGAKYVSYAAAAGLFGLGIFYTGWFLFGLLVLFMGLRNPPPLNDLTSLDTKRYALAALVAAVLITGFVIVPIQAPTGSVGVSAGNPVYPHAPPPEVAANVTVRIQNGDPVSHAFVFDLTVRNVSVSGGNGTVALNESAVAAWAASTNWTFVLPDGSTVAVPPGETAALPDTDYVPVPAGDARTVGIAFSNPQGAVEVVLAFTAQELCPPATGGSAETSIVLAF